MDDDTKKVLGCSGLIFVALLVRIGLAQKASGCFSGWQSVFVLIFVALIFSITFFMMDEGKGMKLLGGILLILSILLIASVGTFLVTGNYTLSNAWLWSGSGANHSLHRWQRPTNFRTNFCRRLCENSHRTCFNAGAHDRRWANARSRARLQKEGRRSLRRQVLPEATDTPVPTATPVATATPKGGNSRLLPNPPSGAGVVEVSLDSGIEAMTRSLDQVWAMDEAQAAEAIAGPQYQANRCLVKNKPGRCFWLAWLISVPGNLAPPTICTRRFQDSADTPYAVTVGLNKLMEKRKQPPRKWMRFMICSRARMPRAGS